MWEIGQKWLLNIWSAVHVLTLPILKEATEVPDYLFLCFSDLILGEFQTIQTQFSLSEWTIHYYETKGLVGSTH